ARTGALAAMAHARSNPVRNLAARFSADGAWLLTFGAYAPPQLWRASDLSTVAELGRTGVAVARLAPDGVVSGAVDGTARLRSLGGAELARWSAPGAKLVGVGQTADGVRTVGVDIKGGVRSWVPTVRLRGPLPLHRLEPRFVGVVNEAVEVWDDEGLVAPFH